MIQWMIKTFVKDHEDIRNSKVRTRYNILGSGVAMCCNLFLFLLKIVLGVLTRSVSVAADAFNNLSDCVSNVISIIGVKMADKPADRDHPFGHGRMEYLSALVVAFIVLEVGVTFLRESVGKILHPQKMVLHWAVITGLVLSIAVKLWMSYFNRKLGRQIRSKVMEATATDALGDVLATLAVLVSLAVYGLFDVNIDGFAGVLVSLFIIWAGIGIIRDVSAPLLGEALDPEVYQQITRFVESYPGILGTHDLIVHNYGPVNSMASIHAEISGKQDIMESHGLIDTIEREAHKELGIFLVIHMDPVELDSETSKVRKKVETILRNLDDRLTIHDFRMDKEKGIQKLTFDMMVPFEFDQEQEDALKKKLEELLGLSGKTYNCEITFDKSFVASAEDKGGDL